MYSSYGNQHQRSDANTLRFTPPGFKFPIDVQFPPRCLPVCERCKKSCRTRDHCRGRVCHTDLAWRETFVCVSLDNTCTGDDAGGRLVLLDGPFVARVVPPIAPFHLNQEQVLDPRTPLCSHCKDKNYTRAYCRQKKKHRELPWSTVYVIVSLRPGTVPKRSSSLSMDTPRSGKRKKTNIGKSVKVEGSSDGDGSGNVNEVSDLKRKGQLLEGERGAGADPEDVVDSKIVKKDETITTMPGKDQFAKNKKSEERKRRMDDQVSGNESSSTASKADSEQDFVSNQSPAKLSASKEKHLHVNKGTPSKKSTKSKKQNDNDDENDLEAMKAIEAAKLENIPRSRTFLVTVSSKLHRIEWVDIEPVLAYQLPILNDILNKKNHSDKQANKGYDMRNANPMMNHNMSKNSMDIKSAGGGSGINHDMKNINSMNRRMMRGQDTGNEKGTNHMRGHDSMGSSHCSGGRGMSAMNAPSSFFNDGMDFQMMGGQMSRSGGAQQNMMSQMNQMRQMEFRMNQMNRMHSEGRMGGAKSFEPPTMSNRRMSFVPGQGGSGRFPSQQEMLQHEQDMPNSQMQFGAQSRMVAGMPNSQVQFGDQSHMVAGMPFQEMDQSDFRPMERMGMGTAGHDMMFRTGVGAGSGSNMMGMSRSGADVGLSGRDIMMQGMGSGQDMMRTSPIEREGQDMLDMRGGINMGMGDQDWRAMGDQPGGGYIGQGGDSDTSIQDRAGNCGKEKEKEF